MGLQDFPSEIFGFPRKKRACRIYDEKCNLRHAFCDFHEYRSSFFPLARKKGTFSDVLGISTVATVDLGRRPKNPQTFEKV
ncbi:MAG: hypothetical protein IJ480_09720 [Clostridia bacterium]|nr:hypothetical protein [Clostridia bacterium]